MTIDHDAGVADHSVMSPLTVDYQQVRLTEPNMKLLCSLAYLADEEGDFNATLARALGLLRDQVTQPRRVVDATGVNGKRVGRPPKVK